MRFLKKSIDLVLVVQNYFTFLLGRSGKQKAFSRLRMPVVQACNNRNIHIWKVYVLIRMSVAAAAAAQKHRTAERILYKSSDTTDVERNNFTRLKLRFFLLLRSLIED